MDDLGWLRLQVEWGADEALDDQPLDRRNRPAPPMPTGVGPSLASAPPRPPAALATGAGALARAQALAQAAQSPAALREALAGFDGCALRATATTLVFSDGNPASDIVLLADVPGAAEDRAGLPFAGPAATFLDTMLGSAGLDRSDLLATSLLPWRPPGDRKPADAEIQLCLPFLHRHLQLVAPRAVLVFGGLAAKALLPGDGRKTRAAWQDLAVPGLATGVRCLAFPSVLHIQATPACKREAWAHLVRLKRFMAETA